MSVESAKAFCARMMSDDEFRNGIGAASDAAAIAALISPEYNFSKADLLKVISELLGKKIEADQLSAMVCEVYESEIKTADGKGSAEAVAAWLAGLK